MNTDDIFKNKELKMKKELVFYGLMKTNMAVFTIRNLIFPLYTDIHLIIKVSHCIDEFWII